MKVYYRLIGNRQEIKQGDLVKINFSEGLDNVNPEIES